MQEEENKYGRVYLDDRHVSELQQEVGEIDDNDLLDAIQPPKLLIQREEMKQIPGVQNQSEESIEYISPNYDDMIESESNQTVTLLGRDQDRTQELVQKTQKQLENIVSVRQHSENNQSHSEVDLAFVNKYVGFRIKNFTVSLDQTSAKVYQLHADQTNGAPQAAYLHIRRIDGNVYLEDP